MFFRILRITWSQSFSFAINLLPIFRRYQRKEACSHALALRYSEIPAVTVVDKCSGAVRSPLHNKLSLVFNDQTITLLTKAESFFCTLALGYVKGRSDHCGFALELDRSR